MSDWVPTDISGWTGPQSLSVGVLKDSNSIGKQPKSVGGRGVCRMALASSRVPCCFVPSDAICLELEFLFAPSGYICLVNTLQSCRELINTMDLPC